MMLKHSRTPVEGQPVENTFVAVDERTGQQLGACTVFCDENPALYPARPVQVRLQLEGNPIPDALLGAAVARGRELCSASGKFCRLYTRCDPDDQETLDALAPMGFKDNDGLVRMQLRLPCVADYRLPTGCVVVKDDLSDPMEQKFFLERYNELYNTDHDFEWLRSFIDRKDFKRILAVSPTGMAGEILIWREDCAGVIGYIQTARRWRRMGVGSCMLGLACEEFEKEKLFVAEANVRARIPHVLRMMEKMGFKQSELLMRYPGLDINP
jgi:GNAT superfamily N-acetyltransferase